jgi:hydrogenase maturation protein HypF
MEANYPPLARINQFNVTPVPRRGFKGFTILPSEGLSAGTSVVPPDAALCPRCREETLSRRDRRYLYPFTNCTNCGPRFTISAALPYDRVNTSMAAFTLCPECAREYNTPLDRRYHAQPVACPACGPGVWLTDGRGNGLEGFWARACGRLLKEGAILAVKGLGGFHLVCDASQREAVVKLRRRKRRPAKPLAVMCRDMDVVREHCLVSPAEESLLKSHHAPIVLLARKGGGLPEELAPGLATLGVMLPYTPLHLILLAHSAPVLVMTSGNSSGLPLVTDNRAAYDQLGGVADYFLLHNRDIVNRCDDSVVAVYSGEEHFFRRSRGYVPSPVPVPLGEGPVVLGSGGEAKNTFCLLKDGKAYLSQHIGDVSLLEGQQNYKGSLDNYCRLLGISPGVVARDAHPDYHTEGLTAHLQVRRRFAVQHHHAHMAACMAENGIEEPVIGLILDGTGYGLDGKIWGFEILAGDYDDFVRIAHLAYLPLPGGERAVRNPWVGAVACLITWLGDAGRQAARSLFPDKGAEIKTIEKMIAQSINSPPASSCGRLFDAVSAILGICRVNTYDGQAAIELGEAVNKEWGHTSANGHGSGDGGMSPMAKDWAYPFEMKGDIIQPGQMFGALLKDLQSGIPVGAIARRFHATVAAMALEGAEKARRERGLNRVVLSGGCWHNKYLLEIARQLLRSKGFGVHCHRLVPPGDGGIALGQAVVGYARWKNNVF